MNTNWDWKMVDNLSECLRLGHLSITYSSRYPSMSYYQFQISDQLLTEFWKIKKPEHQTVYNNQ